MKEIINELIDKKQQLKEEIERKGVDMSTATFSDYGDKIREIGSGSLYVSPLSQLGYSKEDEEFYSDLDYGTLGEMIEDFEYSREQIGKLDGVGNMYSKYNGDTNLKYMPWFDASKATSTDSLFKDCTNLKAFPSVKFTNKMTSASSMFYKCAIERIDCTDWDVSNVKNMQTIFANCVKLANLDVSGFDTSNVTNMYGIFSGNKSLEFVDVSKWNTSKVTTFAYMFQNCGIVNPDVSMFDISSATSLEGMFKNNNAITSLDVSNWNTSNVTNMSNMFYGCSSLTSLDVSNWNTSNVTNMSNMFNGCSKLESLDVSKWDVGKVTNMGGIFSGCTNLANIDVSSWTTSSVTLVNDMFKNCSNVVRIDLRGFDTSAITNMNSMFLGCGNLDIIKMVGLGGNAGVSASGLFSQCYNLGSSPEGLEALRNTLIRDSFDRASAGYAAVVIPAPAQVKARLTTDEIAQITAKGFTIA